MKGGRRHENQLGFDLGSGTAGSPSDAPTLASLDREELFFGSLRTAASETKSKIVVSTFLGWAQVMLRQNPVALWYIDLYCGRGVYADGTPSTPIELFRKVCEHPLLPNLLRMVLNDRKPKAVEELERHLRSDPGFNNLRWPPQFTQGPVDEKTVSALLSARPRPFTFAFIDPFGYKGVTQGLINALLQDFGCDLYVFFNYHLIKRVLNNPNVVMRQHLNKLLGTKRVDQLQKALHSTEEQALEHLILSALSESMREISGRYVLPFAFRRRTGSASHHLAFISKNVRGYEVAKEAMGRASTWYYAGDIPSMEFLPERYDQRLLHVDPPSIEKLKALIRKTCAGRTVSVGEAYDAITYGTPYVRANVRTAFVDLVRAGIHLVDEAGAPTNLRGSQLPKKSRIVVPPR